MGFNSGFKGLNDLGANAFAGVTSTFPLRITQRREFKSLVTDGALPRSSGATYRHTAFLFVPYCDMQYAVEGFERLH